MEDRAVFRLPGVALLIPLLALLCTIPLAGAGGAWFVLYLLPLGVLGYVLLTRTVADHQGVRTRTLGLRHDLTWPELDRLEFQGSRWAVAVTQDGTRRRLPMVRPRDLPRLAAASGGRLPWTSPPIVADQPVDAPGSEEPGTAPAPGGATV